jgi:uncharacterized membrane protein
MILVFIIIVDNDIAYLKVGCYHYTCKQIIISYNTKVNSQFDVVYPNNLFSIKSTQTKHP